MNGRHVHTAAVCVSFRSGFRVVRLPAEFWHDFLVGNMVLVRDAYYLAVAPHFNGLVEAVCITLKIQIRHSNSDVVILKSWEGLAHLNLLS